MVVPLTDRGPLGQVQVTISSFNSVAVSGQDLSNALSRIVKPSALEWIKSATDANGNVSLDAAAKAGLPLTFNAEEVSLSINIPASAMRSRNVGLGYYNNDFGAQASNQPTFATAFLNYHAAVIDQISGGAQGGVDVAGNLELGGRIGIFSFENFATFDGKGQNAFVRDASRLIYDLPGPAIRLTAGDLITDTTGFQTDPQIAGFNATHLVSTFNAAVPTSEASSRSLTLTQASTVEVDINGLPVTQLQMGPGTFDLRDLPILQGANNVRLVITDETGDRRTVNFSFFGDARLLNPGVDEYAVSAGMLAPLENNGPLYVPSEPVASGFYRRGLTEQLTLGGNFQATKFNQVIGGDVVWGNRLGIFAIDVAANHIDRDGLSALPAVLGGGASTATAPTGYGAAVQVQYQWASNTNTSMANQVKTFTASVQAQTPLFSSVNSINQNNNQVVIAAASYSMPITRTFSLQLAGNYDVERKPLPDTYGASAFITWSSPRGDTTIGAGAIYQYVPNDAAFGTAVEGRGLTAAVTLVHHFGLRALLTGDANAFEDRLDFSRSPARSINDYALNADINHTQAGTTGDAIATYYTNRGAVFADYNAEADQAGHLDSQSVSVGFDGSFALADGRFAIGQHISDGFAIVDPHETLEGHQVIIENRVGTVIAETGLFGPALLPLTSYTRQVIPFEVRDLPPGYDLGDGDFILYPQLHSGYRLTVGSAFNVTAVGNLVDAKGEPVRLRSGVAIDLSNPKAPPAQLITNRSGRFAVSGLSVGRWRVTIPGETPLVYDLVITKQQRMLVRAGVIHPNPASLEGPSR